MSCCQFLGFYGGKSDGGAVVVLGDGYNHDVGFDASLRRFQNALVCLLLMEMWWSREWLAIKLIRVA